MVIVLVIYLFKYKLYWDFLFIWRGDLEKSEGGWLKWVSGSEIVDY